MGTTEITSTNLGEMKMAQERLHYNIADKTKIIQKFTQLEKPYAEQLARTTDSFTFAELKNLIKAFQVIAKGKSKLIYPHV